MAPSPTETDGLAGINQLTVSERHAPAGQVVAIVLCAQFDCRHGARDNRNIP